jgi:hypothetical protein
MQFAEKEDRQDVGSSRPHEYRSAGLTLLDLLPLLHQLNGVVMNGV